MRRQGVKAAGVEADFTWDIGVNALAITNLSYYSSYSRRATRFRQSRPDSDAFSQELASAATPIIRRQLERAIPAKLADDRLSRATGHILVMLYDDPCLPVRARLSELADPDITPLMKAVSSQDLPRFYALLQNGADPNAHTQHGSTPLMAASFAANAEMVRMLLNRGARANDRDIDGRTALHEAAEHENAANVIPLLLNAGAEANAKLGPTAGRLAGATPLIIAASMGNGQAVKLLLHAGADRNALTWDGMTALDVARHPILLRPEKLQIIKMLETGDGT